MTSEEDWREVEQLQREAEQLKSYLERPDISSKEKLERAIEVRERHLKVLSERRRNRPRIRLAPLPPQLLRLAGAASTTAKEEIMTYEQVETTMQFILEQQAASSERQKQFEENLARINDTFAASADWQKRFEENLGRINDSIAASTDWQKRFEEDFAQRNAESAKWQKQFEVNIGRLMGDAIGHSVMIGQTNSQLDELTVRLNTLAGHLTVLTENVNTLSATVKNMIKGGSNGNQQL